MSVRLGGSMCDKQPLMLGQSRERSFWRRVIRTDGNCWEWSGSKDRDGYGQVILAGHTWRAHRIAWMLTYGEITSKEHVLHKCDNRSCINPDHLFLGDPKINSDDAVAKGRKIMSRKGENHGRALLTEDLVRKIRNSPELPSVLSRQLGVHLCTIIAARLGRTWKHVQ